MEMPCVCDCGEVFDLHDGKPQKGSNTVICQDCYENEEDESNEAEKEFIINKLESLRATLKIKEKEFEAISEKYHDVGEEVEFLEAEIEDLESELEDLE